MKVYFPFTLVQPGPTGMFVANGGETHDLPDEFAQSLVDRGKAEKVADDDVTAAIVDDKGNPLNPPIGDIAADIANPSVIDEKVKAKRGRAPAADPLDSPVA